MTYYVGLDVALRSVSACVIDDQGGIIKEAKLDSEVEAIVAWLAPIRHEIKIVGLEAARSMALSEPPSRPILHCLMRCYLYWMPVWSSTVRSWRWIAVPGRWHKKTRYADD